MIRIRYVLKAGGKTEVWVSPEACAMYLSPEGEQFSAPTRPRSAKK
jgi:hypothetical protein